MPNPAFDRETRGNAHDSLRRSRKPETTSSGAEFQRHADVLDDAERARGGRGGVYADTLTGDRYATLLDSTHTAGNWRDIGVDMETM